MNVRARKKTTTTLPEPSLKKKKRAPLGEVEAEGGGVEVRRGVDHVDHGALLVF